MSSCRGFDEVILDEVMTHVDRVIRLCSTFAEVTYFAVGGEFS